MFQFLLLLMFNPSEYGAPQAHQDSAYIYNVYKESAKILEKTSQPTRWGVVDDSLSKLTADAFQRLYNYNHEKYESLVDFNKEGVGFASAYPEPSDFVEPVLKKSASLAIANTPEPKPQITGYFEKTVPVSKPREVVRTEPKPEQPAASKEIAFKVLDRQTHFLLDKNGKTIAPYLIMNYYAKGRILVKSEKLNPITLEVIQTDEPVVATGED